MDNFSDDIIKYKKGELSPEQMHALEKKALSDKFLAEALDGIENISAEDLTADISSINKNISHQKKIVLLTPLRIAAGILLLIGSIFLIYQFRPKPETLALKMEKPKAREKTESKSEENKKDEGERSSVESEKLQSEEDKLKSHETLTARIQHQESSDKNPVSELQPIAPANPTAAGQAAPPIESLASADKQIKTEEADMDDQKINDVAEKEERAAIAKPAVLDKKKESFAISQARRSEQPMNIKTARSISGKVVSAEDGAPLPGVTITIKGTSTGTVTDSEGNYSIPVKDDNSRLVFSFIGFQQKEVNSIGKENLDVPMKEEVIQLSEVVVTRGDKTSNNGEPVTILAEPLGGKKAYDAYLESNLAIPIEAKENKVKGKAGIEFKVNKDGSLSNFRIIKKLGYGCEEEIIRLVNEGPKWNPTKVDGHPMEASVRVFLRFDITKSGR